MRILIANYAIPDAYLEARDRDVFEFRFPSTRSGPDMSFTVPPRRTHARAPMWSTIRSRLSTCRGGTAPTGRAVPSRRSAPRRDRESMTVTAARQ